MSINLMKLPYKENHLEPYISKETIHYHYNKHHSSYVLNLNKLLDTYLNKSEFILEDIIKTFDGAEFNNASQVWNHNFYWMCLGRGKVNSLSNDMLDLINLNFGSFDKFKGEFIDTSMTLFGSGWVWLLLNNQENKLFIKKMSNADSILSFTNLTPLLVCDLWEHSYYLDYKNNRLAYLNSFFEIINWKFVSGLVF